MNTLSTTKSSAYNKTRYNLLHYNFEGGTATDLYNKYDGVVLGGCVVSTLSKFGSYSSFSDGQALGNKYIVIPSITFVNANGLSISLFVYTVAQPVGGDCKVFELTKEKLMVWGRVASNSFNFGNGTEFLMPLATWNHLVITINPISGINVYVNNVLTVTETIASLYPTGTLIHPGTIPQDKGKLNKSISSLHRSHNGYIDDFKIYNRVLSATDVGAIFSNSYFP
jgi:Concanavalin A-like lectin/glucanases superfamily